MEYKSLSCRSFPEVNTIKSANEYIARKRAKCSVQGHKGTNKKWQSEFAVGGKLYCK